MSIGHFVVEIMREMTIQTTDRGLQTRTIYDCPFFSIVAVKNKLNCIDSSLIRRFCDNKSLWRNRLARSAVNRKVGGSSPPRDDYIFHFLNIYLNQNSFFKLIQEIKLTFRHTW
jgi:hypothetical protein